MAITVAFAIGGGVHTRTDISKLPADHAAALHQTDVIVRSYLAGLFFIANDTARDPKFLSNHLLSYLAPDILQSVISVIALAREGLLSVAKRELRFLIEASIKICFVQRESYESSVEEKLLAFEKILSSQRISIKENLRLELLPAPSRVEFAEEVGRLYGFASAYVHLTPQQILERIAAAEAGQTFGMEQRGEIHALNEFAERVLAASLVLLFHSAPDWVAGDWLVNDDGSSRRWHFQGSRFIASIDSYFDYKHERKERLDEIQRLRENSIRF